MVKEAMYNENTKKIIRKEYQKGAKPEELSQLYKISASTVKRWASKHKWQRKNDTKSKIQTKRINKNSVQKGGQLKNHNAVFHGLRSKYLPQETLELATGIKSLSVIDILWENICLKYAAILRAQKIMYVADCKDYTKRLTLEGESCAYDYTEAYEKQATFLMAQSRAMATLTSMIKQYEELCRSELATEEQKMRIAKLRSEIDRNTEKPTDSVTIIDNIPVNDKGGKECK